jgi:hypothetical protein
MIATALPWDDRTVGALPDRDRIAVARHWQRRAQSELEVGSAFRAMRVRLRDARVADSLLAMLERGAEDEERHAAICARLAAVYGGRSIAMPDVGDVPLPCFGVEDEALENALLVTGMCCINETIATAWLAACLAVATSPLAIAANRIHLADEIGHARFGWAYLASVPESTRLALAPCIARLLDANVPGWERDDPALPREGIPAHGQLSAEASRAAVREAVRDLVVPGLAHVGITAPAR